MLKRTTFSKTLMHCYARPHATATSAAKQLVVTIGFAEQPNPHDIKCDYIGPPDSQSNLRPYIRHIAQNETFLENRLRTKRNEVEQWNNDFWAKHNKRFYEEKNDFIRLNNLAGYDDISADRMSIFYKHFLDRNRRMHFLYNVSWYLKNFELLTLSLQVQLHNLLRRASRNNNNNKQQ